MPAAKCDKALIGKVKTLIERGIVNWTVISKAVDVGRSTLFEYKNPESCNYNKPFADAVAESMEGYDTGRTKAGQFEQSVRHKLRKVTKERQVTRCPHLPPTSFKKDLVIQYADEELDLILDPKKFTLPEMFYQMSLRIAELIEYGEPYYVVEDVIVKIEETEVDPSPAAVKNVLTNTGDEKKRWTFKDEVALSGDLKIENVIFGKPEKKEEDGS